MLTPGTSYTFQLEFASFSGDEHRTSSVEVETNDIPLPGAIGTEDVTIFDFAAPSWTDSDILLWYMLH